MKTFVNYFPESYSLTEMIINIKTLLSYVCAISCASVALSHRTRNQRTTALPHDPIAHIFQCNTTERELILYLFISPKEI